MIKNAVVQSITAKLNSLAVQRKCSYQELLTQFFIERLVVRIVDREAVATQIIFKGGYFSLRVYNSPRYTTDIDATVKGNVFQAARSIQKAIEEFNSSDGVWFMHESDVDLQTQGEYKGLRLVFRAGLGSIPPNLRSSRSLTLI